MSGFAGRHLALRLIIGTQQEQESRMPGKFHHARKRLTSRRAWKTRLVFWSGAVMVGLSAAIFAIASEHAQQWFRDMVAWSPYLPFVVSPLILVLVTWLTRRFVPGAQGSGIPQSIAALRLKTHATRTALLSIRIAVGKILLTLLGLLGGASIGREGPTVHVGASIMFSLGRVARFPHHDMDRGLILAGSAAGIAAAFNTPLAGIVFAIEEMGRSFEHRTSGTVLTAVIISGITALAMLGNYTYFGSSSAVLLFDTDWVMAVLVCGLGGGLLGGLFSKTLIWGGQRLAPLRSRYGLLIAALCGLGIATIGFLSGNHTYGTGYEEARLLITGSGELTNSFPFLKLLATVVSYLSGIPGGIFAPSLAAGAGLGELFAGLFPATPVTAIIILGMVGYFAGVVQTPITAFVIVMEMTDNHSMVLPLMATAFLGYGVSRLVCQVSIYEALAIPFLHSPTEPTTGTTAARGSDNA
ncbi:MAG: chloride channel protein [Granulosicoccaceae bacterium]